MPADNFLGENKKALVEKSAPTFLIGVE